MPSVYQTLQSQNKLPNTPYFGPIMILGVSTKIGP